MSGLARMADRSAGAQLCRLSLHQLAASSDGVSSARTPPPQTDRARWEQPRHQSPVQTVHATDRARGEQPRHQSPVQTVHEQRPHQRGSISHRFKHRAPGDLNTYSAPLRCSRYRWWWWWWWWWWWSLWYRRLTTIAMDKPSDPPHVIRLHCIIISVGILMCVLSVYHVLDVREYHTNSRFG